MANGGRRSASAVSGPEIPYGELASVYDRIYAWKDYAREARIVRSIVRRWGPPSARNLLDVACGTGAHLRYLSEWYHCTGLDSSAAMLTVARRNLPSVRFVRGQMQSFDLGRRFDVITCLFSAIGYVRTETALRRTARTFARHLTPGGILIVEPWIAPDDWRPGGAHLATVLSEDRPIARMNLSETRRGRSVMDMHYLVAGEHRIRHWVERHEMGLFTPRAMSEAFRAAGLSVRRRPSGFYPGRRMERGLYIATRPLDRA